MGKIKENQVQNYWHFEATYIKLRIFKNDTLFLMRLSQEAEETNKREGFSQWLQIYRLGLVILRACDRLLAVSITILVTTETPILPRGAEVLTA